MYEAQERLAANEGVKTLRHMYDLTYRHAHETVREDGRHYTAEFNAFLWRQFFATHVGDTRNSRRAELTSPGFTAWRAAAAQGYCSPTADGRYDCEHGSKGSFGGVAGRSLAEAARLCVERCAACKRCKFISVSARWADCSWYAHCDLGRLARDLSGFFSARAAASPSWMAPTTRTSEVL